MDAAHRDGRWVLDPTGVHELRWHDGDRFTGYVSDGGHQSIDPLDRRSPEAIRSDFADVNSARRGIAAGLAAIVVGAALTLGALVTAAHGAITVLFALPIVGGASAVWRSARYLRRRRHAPREFVTSPPPQVTFADQVRVIDDLLARGRISAVSHAAARRKLARQYHVDIDGDAGGGRR